MWRALLYLQVTSFVGRVRSRLRRLKEPKYLIGAGIGITYLYLMLIRPRPGRVRGSQTVQAMPEEFLPLAWTAGALLLLIVAALSWVVPRQRAGLTFSEAEIAFLFPAPVKRRTLIHYRLLSSQASLALTALILAFFSRRWSFLGGNGAMHAFGWWLVLATLSLHFTASSFVITRLQDRGISTWRRSLTAFAVLAAVIGGGAFWIANTARAPALEDFASSQALIRYATELSATAPLSWLLIVPKSVLGPFFATDLRAFLPALGPALLVLIAHYVWVLHSEVSFEETSLARAEKRAAWRRNRRQGDWRGTAGKRKPQRDPFPLGPIGPPETAFLWKNLIPLGPIFRARTALFAVLVIAGGGIWLGLDPQRGILLASAGFIGIGLLFMLAFAGPHMFRQDLRSDLPNADILKTYPLRGWQIVLGELLTPAVILTVATWLALLLVVLAAPAFSEPVIPPSLRFAAALAIGALAPAFFLLQLLIPNAMTVLFPAWMKSVADQSQYGLDVMGQRIIVAVGQVLILALALLPAALGALLMFFVTRWLIGDVAAGVAAALLVVGVLAAESWAGILCLGRRFERFDLSSELRP